MAEKVYNINRKEQKKKQMWRLNEEVKLERKNRYVSEPVIDQQQTNHVDI